MNIVFYSWKWSCWLFLCYSFPFFAPVLCAVNWLSNMGTGFVWTRAELTPFADSIINGDALKHCDCNCIHVKCVASPHVRSDSLQPQRWLWTQEAAESHNKPKETCPLRAMPYLLRFREKNFCSVAPNSAQHLRSPLPFQLLGDFLSLTVKGQSFQPP